ncbi:MAG: hypothetical protein Q7S21_07505 [archaeon]|nr:hypothetical protein [archaeon]
MNLGFLSIFLEYVAPQQPWDPLRMAIKFSENIDIITRLVVLALALGILIISFLAYQKNKSSRLFFVTLAFLFFAVKWLLKVLDLFVSPGMFFSDPAENVAELFILAALFIAIFRKN